MLEGVVGCEPIRWKWFKSIISSREPDVSIIVYHSGNQHTSRETMEFPRITIVPSESFSVGLCSKASAMVMFKNTSYPRSVPTTVLDPLS